MSYKATVTGIGEMAIHLLEGRMLIVFNENAPEELKDYSILHTIENLEDDVVPGDTIAFGDQVYSVTAVGDEANFTLRSMGHCTLCFNGAAATELPGQIELAGDDMPTIDVGMTIEILHH